MWWWNFRKLEHNAVCFVGGRWWWQYYRKSVGVRILICSWKIIEVGSTRAWFSPYLILWANDNVNAVFSLVLCFFLEYQMHEKLTLHLDQISNQIMGLCEVTMFMEKLYCVMAVYLCFSLCFLSSTVGAGYVLSNSHKHA